MRSRFVLVGVLVSLAVALSGVTVVAGAVLVPQAADAKVEKSLEGGGGGGSTSGAGQRLGEMLSGWGVPAVMALAGCLMIGALASRNIGASVGIVLITLLALIFFLAPSSIETFAKGVANTVF
jgi:hypothetical protein